MAEAARGGELPGELRQVAARFETWRRTRSSRRARIPEALWSAAAEAARRHGMGRTARVLRLNEQELRRRTGGVVRRHGSVAGEAQPEVGFVEVRPIAVASSMPTWVVEVVNAAGSRLRIEGRAEHELDIASLAATFLRATS